MSGETRGVDRLRVLVSDLDGTLLEFGEPESVGVVDNLQVIQQAGWRMGIATSRSLASVRRVAPGLLNGCEWVVCSDGAVTYTRRPDLPLEEFVLHAEQLLEVHPSFLAQLRAEFERVYVFLGSARAFAIGSLDEHAVGAAQLIADGRSVEFISPEDAGTCCLSVGIWIPSRDGEGLWRGILDEHKISGQTRVYREVRAGTGGGWWMDLSSPTADKAIALRGLPESIQPAVAWGDGENDVGMFSFVSMALCPSWAASSLKESASSVIPAADVQEFVEKAASITLAYGGGS